MQNSKKIHININTKENDESRHRRKFQKKLGLEKGDVQATIESFMEEVKNCLETGDNVYLRGFGSFIIKTRAEKQEETFLKTLQLKFLLTTFQLSNLLKCLLKA